MALDDPHRALDSDGSAPEPDPVITLDEPDPKAGKLDYKEDDPNLCFTFEKTPEGRKWLKEASDMVLEDFQDDWDSTEEYRERMADDWGIFAGNLPKKLYPFEKMANVSLPLMLENINRIATHFYAEIFDDFGRFFSVLPVGLDDADIADILTRHGNWQLGHQLPDFKRQMARATTIFTAVGDLSTYSYYDTFREQNVHEVLTCDEIVVPYSHVTTMPDYSDLPHIILIRRLYRHQLQAMRSVLCGVDEVLEGKPPSWEDDPELTLKRATDEHHGIEATENVRSNAYVVYQWEGWKDLPGQDDQRFCQILVEKDTRAVLGCKIMEEEDWQDRERFDRQTQEQQQYDAAKAQYDQMTVEHGHAANAHAEIASEIPGIAQHDQHAQDLTNALGPAPQLPPAPPMPDWMMGTATEPPLASPKPVKKRPLHMAGHAVCIEPLVGNLGLSFGRMQADHNRGVNTLVSQFVDAASLANIPGMIRAPGVRFKGGKPEWYPGASIELENMPAGGFQNAFQMMQHGQANPQMMELVDSLWQKAASSIQSEPVLSGAPGKSGETFRGISSRQEQAMKQLSVPASFLADCVRNLIKNNAKLNAEFLADEEVFMVNDERAMEMPELKLGRQLYRRNYQIKLNSDLSFATDAQRISTADEAAQMATAFPPLQANPKYLYEALKNCLEARGLFKLVAALGPPPPPTQIPFGTPPPAPPGAPPGQPGQPGPSAGPPNQPT